MKTYQIHLLRHATTQGNLDGLYVGHTDMEATEAGLRQIDDLKENYGGYPEVDAVFSSPLKRCLQTAKRMYPEKEPIVLEGLSEYDFGEFECKSADELKDEKAFQDWLAGTHPETPLPFGESQLAFNERICRTFAQILEGILQSGVRSTAVVTHGGVIMALMTAFAVPEAPMHEWMTPNGCGYTLRLDPSVYLRTGKLEAFSECPAVPLTEADEHELWDYYPEDDFSDWAQFETDE